MVEPMTAEEKRSLTNVLSFFGRLELNMQLSQWCLSILKCKRNHYITTEEVLTVIRTCISLISLIFCLALQRVRKAELDLMNKITKFLLQFAEHTKINVCLLVYL